MPRLFNSTLIATTLVVVGTLTATASMALKDPGKPMPVLQGAPGAVLSAVSTLDLARYSGSWYEQARLPNRFQQDCVADVVAEYTLRDDGTLGVTNRCATRQGAQAEAVGEGRRVSAVRAPQGQLEVRFAPAWLSWLSTVWGDYWVIGLDDAYRTALVGTPDREYLWLLSRDPVLPAAQVSLWLDKAAALGFDTDKVVRTPHEAKLPSLH